MQRKWLILHWIIIVNFVVEIFYGMYQTFFVLVPPGAPPGPLFGSSIEIPFELMVTRRLYAIETWIAIFGLSVYLAIVYRDQLKAEKSNPSERTSSTQ